MLTYLYVEHNDFRSLFFAVYLTFFSITCKTSKLFASFLCKMPMTRKLLMFQMAGIEGLKLYTKLSVVDNFDVLQVIEKKLK